MLHDLIEQTVTVENGTIAIPDAPGLGITVREDFLAAHTVAG
jgi:L-alanine-DL-glutamate epimerase-like enolase superfamily enzyme